MHLNRWGVRLGLAAMIFIGALACRTADVFVAQATVTPTRTPRPTFTPLPPPTNTPAPSPTNPPPPTVVPKTPTRTPTRRPPTPKPPAPPPAAPQPTAVPASTYEYHVNPPHGVTDNTRRCEHSGMTYFKATVYKSAHCRGFGGHRRLDSHPFGRIALAIK